MSKFENAKLFQTRDELIEYCKQFIILNPVIAEVGVFQGYNSENLIQKLNPSKMFLIDTFSTNDHWTNKFNPKTHLKFIQDKFKTNSSVEIMQGLSWDCLEKLEDNSLDYIYLDAGHSYAEVKKDTELCLKKIKSGGIIQFNDYTNWSIVEKADYGVLDVVNEVILSQNVEVLGLGLHFKGYHDISLKIKKT
jgi:hypothetical protein